MRDAGLLCVGAVPSRDQPGMKEVHEGLPPHTAADVLEWCVLWTVRRWTVRRRKDRDKPGWLSNGKPLAEVEHPRPS